MPLPMCSPGAAEPGGRLPQTFPARLSDNPTQSQDREVYPGLNGKVRYEEGVFIGYRHYDRHGITPLFPFGFGLSYTSFALSDLAVDASRFESDGVVEVAVTLTNTGARKGSDVVQIYVSDPEASVPRPKQELKAFAKVALNAGESRRVTLSLDDRCFAFLRREGQALGGRARQLRHPRRPPCGRSGSFRRDQPHHAIVAAGLRCVKKAPLTRPAADLSTEGRGEPWQDRATSRLSLWGRGRRAAPGEGAFPLQGPQLPVCQVTSPSNPRHCGVACLEHCICGC